MKLRTPLAILRRAGRRKRHGYPMGTVAFYGPDDCRASKVVAGVILTEGSEPILQKWFSESVDLRHDAPTLAAIIAIFNAHRVISVAFMERILGCPHEETVDYPEGAECPKCPFWHGRDRWAGVYERPEGIEPLAGANGG